MFVKVKMCDERGRAQRSSHLPRSECFVYARMAVAKEIFAHYPMRTPLVCRPQ